MYKKTQITKRYSEGFKLKMLNELSTGKYTKREMFRMYGINSSTLNDWIRKYERLDLMNTRIMVENKDDLTKVKQLEKEIAQLKKLILKKDLDQMAIESYLEVAAEMLGLKNVAELKKKLSTGQ
jgi:transposase-like protein